MQVLSRGTSLYGLLCIPLRFCVVAVVLLCCKGSCRP
jgi:hypothetical protein